MGKIENIFSQATELNEYELKVLLSMLQRHLSGETEVRETYPVAPRERAKTFRKCAIE